MTAVVGPVVQNLISLLRQEFNLTKGMKKDVEKLTGMLSTIQGVLQDAETQQLKSKSITIWLKDLKNATYDAEDLLEEWSIEEAQRSGQEFTNTCCASKVSHFISTSVSFNIIFRHKMANKLKEVISKFDDIAERKNKFHLNVDVPHTEPQIDKNRVTTSKITEPRIYGRDGDKKNVTDILLNNVDSPEDVSICAIVGFGGVGKTTLAQSVYNDERVVRCFEVRIWVCVSEPFDIERVLKAIIEAFEKKPCDLKTLESIQSKVGDILRDKRYLLVLDDVWNENQDEWNKLEGFLNCGAKGSSIILTTRLQGVASSTGARSYRLEVLSDDDCWYVLKYRALGDRSEEEHPNLVKIGRDIVKKCKGLPLAAKSLGSLLGSKIDEKHWKLVRDNEIWNFEEGGENSILPALRLSYNHLPPHLKQCFSYCSIFPKDHEMEKNKLIRLWIANGSLQSQGRMELEEVGDDAFNDLLWLSFFQDTEEDEYGNVKTFKMHDLMHDLACSVAVDECLITKLSETKNVPKTIRHLSVIFNSSQPSISVEALVRSQPSLRTLIFDFESPPAKFPKFPTTLRVLNLSHMGINTLPPSIRHLKHLRYLDISSNSFKSLPESICDLRNLQSLALEECDNLQALPENMRNMSSLRHLDLNGCLDLHKMPVGIGKLKCLQTLNFFVVGVPDRCCGIFGNDRCGGIKELQELNHLRVLWIKDLQNVRNPEDAKKANLKDKQYLTELGLIWSGEDDDDDLLQEINEDPLQEIKSKKVLEGLGLPPNLQVLGIELYHATDFPQGFLQNVNALKSLSLGGCFKLKSLPAEMKNLTALTSLTIEECKELVLSDEDFQHLTSLQHLELYSLPKLRALPRGCNTSPCSANWKFTSARISQCCLNGCNTSLLFRV